MKISWTNIENWRSWKTSFFLRRPFWIFKSAILIFFLLHLSGKSSPFIWDIIYFCTMDGFSRILEKKLSELLCTICSRVVMYKGFYPYPRVITLPYPWWLAPTGTLPFNTLWKNLKPYPPLTLWRVRVRVYPRVTPLKGRKSPPYSSYTHWRMQV